MPILVPAFSSKGFEMKATGKGAKRRAYSEIAYELEKFGEHQRRAVLVSAYDIHHGHFRAPDLATAPDVYLRNTALVFIDSGGYELSSYFDSTEPRVFPYTKKAFSPEDYQSVLDRLAKKPPAPIVIANYDHEMVGIALEKQIRSARTLFNQFPSFASDFIIKPFKGKHLDPEDLSDKDIKSLRGFTIIGVTEKDLARDLFDRLRRVALLRKRLTQHGIEAPIHVWGGLEPLATALFFFAGAEIVDGISWLRYAYRNGVAIARESYCTVSALGITAPSLLNHFHASIDNLATLERTIISLQQWVDLDGSDFSMFHEDVRDSLREAYAVMRAKIPYINGGV